MLIQNKQFSPCVIEKPIFKITDGEGFHTHNKIAKAAR